VGDPGQIDSNLLKTSDPRGRKKPNVAKTFSVDAISSSPRRKVLEGICLGRPEILFYQRYRFRQSRPDKPEYVEVGFEVAIAVAINGETCRQRTLLAKLNDLAQARLRPP